MLELSRSWLRFDRLDVPSANIPSRVPRKAPRRYHSSTPCQKSCPTGQPSSDKAEANFAFQLKLKLSRNDTCILRMAAMLRQGTLTGICIGDLSVWPGVSGTVCSRVKEYVPVSASQASVALTMGVPACKYHRSNCERSRSFASCMCIHICVYVYIDNTVDKKPYDGRYTQKRHLSSVLYIHI